MNSYWKSSRTNASSVIGQLLIASILLFAANTFANNNQIEVRQFKNANSWKTGYPDVSVVGQFKRGDGTVVKAGNEKSISMAMGPVPTKCTFLLTDGTVVTVGKKHDVCLVRPMDSVAELYRYENTFPFERLFPFASRVQQFDGYTLVDITTLGKRLFSSVIHIRTYRFEYLVTIVLFTLLASLRIVGKRIIKPNPKQRWLAFIRIIGIILYALLMIICVVQLLYEAIGIGSNTLFSVYLVMFGVGFVLYRLIDKFAQQKWGGQEA